MPGSVVCCKRLGQRKKAQRFIAKGSWFLRRWYFYFCHVIVYGYFTRKKTHRYHLSLITSQCMQWLSTLSVGNKWNIVGAKTMSLWKWIFALFLLLKRSAVNWRTRQNAARPFSKQNHFKRSFSYSALQTANIARTNYNSWTGESAQPDKYTMAILY